MSSLFLLCAVIGGTLLACQSLLTLLGMGGHHDFGSGHDFSADHSASISADHGVSHEGGAAHPTEHGAASIFRILTFRTIVAALAFFGLAGLAALASGWNDVQSLVPATGAGALAVWGVHHLMRGLARLRVDGTVRLRDAIGRQGLVYLRIPAAAQGVGKVHLTVHDHMLELSARSVDEEIATGQSVRVLRILGPDLVEVAPEIATAR